MDQAQSILEALGAMGVVGTLVIGVLAGVVATIVMPGDDPSGLLVTPLLGIAGSGLATYLGQVLDLSVAGDVSGFVAAVVGALLILLGYRIIFRKAR